MFNRPVFVVKREPEELATRRVEGALFAPCSASPGDTKGNQRAGQEEQAAGLWNARRSCRRIIPNTRGLEQRGWIVARSIQRC